MLPQEIIRKKRDGQVLSAEEIAAIADELFADDVLAEFKRQYNARIAAGDAG